MSDDGKVYVWENLTAVRSGGAVPQRAGDPDNVVGSVDKGHYPALYQCQGQEVTETHGHTTYSNYWWVKIEFEPGREGWVSAVRLQDGENDQPQPGVPPRPTTFV